MRAADAAWPEACGAHLQEGAGGLDAVIERARELRHPRQRASPAAALRLRLWRWRRLRLTLGLRHGALCSHTQRRSAPRYAATGALCGGEGRRGDPFGFDLPLPHPLRSKRPRRKPLEGAHPAACVDNAAHVCGTHAHE